MKPARADRPIDPPAVDPLELYLAEMSEMRLNMRQLQADVFRLIAANVARDKADEMTVAAQQNAGDGTATRETDAAKIARLEAANTILKKLAVTIGLLQVHDADPWVTTSEAAFRFGRCGQRMLQLGEAGELVTRRRGRGPVQYLRSSIDALLFVLGREPQLTRKEQLARDKAKAEAMLT
jgi:hypothetical protein